MAVPIFATVWPRQFPSTTPLPLPRQVVTMNDGGGGRSHSRLNSTRNCWNFPSSRVKISAKARQLLLDANGKRTLRGASLVIARRSCSILTSTNPYFEYQVTRAFPRLHFSPPARISPNNSSPLVQVSVVYPSTRPPASETRPQTSPTHPDHARASHPALHNHARSPHADPRGRAAVWSPQNGS